jgi:hypothetical protein
VVGEAAFALFEGSVYGLGAPMVLGGAVVWIYCCHFLLSLFFVAHPASRQLFSHEECVAFAVRRLQNLNK